MKVIFSGGGTLGSVTPLLAIADHLKSLHHDAEFVWVGTEAGPERDVLAAERMRYLPLAAGKLRRYVSFLNVIDVARLLIGFVQACRILWREDPDACISAGAYVSVPLHLAAWWFGVPAWIHVEDIQIGFANRLMAPFARVITTATEQNVKKFARKKSIWLGSPMRPEFFSGNKIEAAKFFHLQAGLPTILVIGGSAGSLRVNQIVVEAIHHLEGAAQIIHLTGRDRPQELIRRAETGFPQYHPYQFLTGEMKHAYAAADIVVARAGFGTLAEAAARQKTLILIPKAGHQEINAKYLMNKEAALALDERTATGAHLAQLIKQLLAGSGRRNELGKKLALALPVAKKEDIALTFKKTIGVAM